jgi:predicted O-methyltransferase YrrM
MEPGAARPKGGSPMSSLTSSPVAEVLEQLFADAARTQQAFLERTAQLPPATDESGAGPPGDTRAFFAMAKDVHLAVSRQTGILLYILARSRRARTIVEFGTSFGVSTICLAAALKDNNGDILIGTEFEPVKVAGARQAVAAAGLAALVEVREGDALETLARDLPDAIDVVFLDGAKHLYLDVLQLLEPRLSADALVVADNASRSEGYLTHVRSSGAYLSIGAGSDVEISLRGSTESRPPRVAS